jgi:MerR family transcriptional regulator, heat shock protein HspR
MAHRHHNRAIELARSDWVVDDGPNEEPRYAISVVAARVGVHVTTVRRYEEWGLVEPARSGSRRLYSEADIERLRRIRRLVDELGVNLAGAGAILHMRQQVIALQREMQTLRDQLDRRG